MYPDPDRTVLLEIESVMAALCSPETSMAEIIRIVERDAALSRRVIRLANSAFFAGRSRVQSVREAVVRMGTANVAAAMLDAA
ncbi:MAG: HDOD domain-containing protein [Myxococcales bacterium]